MKDIFRVIFGVIGVLSFIVSLFAILLGHGDWDEWCTLIVGCIALIVFLVKPELFKDILDLF